MHRTPKNYDGIAPPAKSIREVLPTVLESIRKRGGKESVSILDAWPEIIGSKMAPMAKAISFEYGVLTVMVQSSALYSLLCQHEKPRLLHMLQERFPNNQVRNIHFRIG